jgi:hypothetical protein
MTDLPGSPFLPESTLDDQDRAVLDRLAAIDDLLDPPPADLDERVRFVLALGGIEGELARLRHDQLVGSGARASESTRTVTFDAHSRTIMITIVGQPDGSVRLDGWLAPAAALRVELRFPEPAPSRFVTADEAGRFVFDGVPHGLVQLLVHPPEGESDGDQPRVVTPSLAL